MGEEMILITVKEHRELLRSGYLLSWLESLGVDNWMEYSHPPDMDDYATVEEYEKAFTDALDAVW